jgi:tetratricopeptide (TPR) repeat protein
LHASITPAPRGFHLEAQIVDTSTGLPIREYRSNITAGALPSALPEALTATVAAAFHLPRAAVVETVSAAAAPAYATANSLLRTDASKGPAAAAAFERAIVLDPASPLPRAGFAEAAFNAWRSTKDATWLTRGREQLALAIERSPDSLYVHLAAGKLSLASGAYERAREEFERATQIEPISAEAWRGLALANESMTGHEGEAAAAYLKVSQVQPSYYGPLNDLCLFYRRMGKYSQSIDYCRQVTKLEPALLQGHLNLGAVLSEAGRHSDDERELRLALHIDSKSRVALNSLAAEYQYLGRDADAVATLRQARTVSPDNAILMLNLGDSLRRLGRAAEAKSAYLRGLELTRPVTSQNSRDAVSRAYLAYFLVRLNQSQAGRAELEQALGLDERNMNVLRRAILCFVASGDNARAIALLRSAPPDLVHDLERHPDLVALWKDPAVRALVQSAVPSQ